MRGSKAFLLYCMGNHLLPSTGRGRAQARLQHGAQAELQPGLAELGSILSRDRCFEFDFPGLRDVGWLPLVSAGWRWGQAARFLTAGARSLWPFGSLSS